MPDLVQNYSTSKYDDSQLGDIVLGMERAAKDSRKNFERRWYDNNFFDDGFHFRYLSRSQNKVLDLSEKASLWAPMRAIPKASKQIRGLVNLLISQDYCPVVYPEKVNRNEYKIQLPDPQTGQLVEQLRPEYQEAVDQAKKQAQNSGFWLEEMLKKEEIKDQKIPHMGILTAKHGISYLKVWPDPIEEDINSTVRDAFDVYVIGSLTETSDAPFMGEGVPRSIAEIKADERFDPNQLAQISAENKHASSEIKDAYMRAQYGGEFNGAEYTSTLIQKEFYIKEYLNDENVKRIRAQEKGDDILKRHKDSMGKVKFGDPVFRQVFSAGNVPLRSSYVNLPDYPYVDLRLEPGPLYQVPLIERFIPSNKSLDMVVSRVERYTHTMVTGSWSQKVGEPQEPNNSAGGQVFKYRTTPPVQNQIAPIPPFVFNFLSLLGSFMEEQGVTTSTLGKLPAGVKANAAIESLKESEYASLIMSTKQLKKTMKRIAEKFFDAADDNFVSPHTVYRLEKGEPKYFDVIGSTGLEKRKQVGLTEDLTGEEVPLKRDFRVDIEVQSGLGYTKEGKKAAAKELGDYLVQLAGVNMVSPEVVKVFFETLLKEYQFGPTQEIMEAMEEAIKTGGMTEDELMKIKIAVIEVLKEAGVVGPEAEAKLVESTKVGMMEVLSDTGLDERLANDPKAQIEIAKAEQEMKHKEEEHEMDMSLKEQEVEMKRETAGVDIKIKAAEKAQGMRLKEEQSKHNREIQEKMVKQKKLSEPFRDTVKK